ncbi:fumarylacetoacetate hydrolase family protein [Actinoallomurus sp. CA-142502]|uniref:fumarylacetoacetate hydrolase family protein n=1 Tax=Actinoallomurus sp. CA-142502 TaxID=3239885 RepID=UPI003D8C774A
MRIANLSGRLAVLDGGLAVDVETASGGRFGPDPQAVYQRWAEFTAWAGRASLPAGQAYDPRALGSPVPAPRQVFAIGLNFDEHAAESGFVPPDTEPPVFTKFVSSITGPYTEVVIPPGGNVDWEVELVAVIGEPARDVAAGDAWSHVAGLSVGQDLSERVLQMAATPPQFSLGKSYPGFGPIGPCLVTVDEFDDPDDLELGCAINGETVQKSRTSEMIFPVPQLIAKLSAVTPLLPGDVIFTGTPAGVGLGRTPQRWLAPGDELVSHVSGIGELRQRFVAAS